MLIFYHMVAAWEDMHKKKIPNAVHILAFIYAILYQAGKSGFQGIAFAFRQSLILFPLVFFLYTTGKFGAGDGKLLCVTAAFLTWKEALTVFIFGLYAAFLPALYKAFRKKSSGEKERDRLPMAVFFFVGMLIVWKGRCFIY